MMNNEYYFILSAPAQIFLKKICVFEIKKKNFLIQYKEEITGLA